MLTPDLVDDFVNLTLSKFKRHKWTDISLEHQEYPSSSIIREKNVVEQGGKDISFRLKTKNTGNAKPSGLYEPDTPRVEDVTISASVPWAMQTVSWSYDIYEDLFQSDNETIIRELLIREHDAKSDMAELTEEQMWDSTNPTGPTDNTAPRGIPHWLTKDATTTPDGAFNGVDPTGFTTAGRAGVPSATYPRWKNWTFGYTQVSPDDLVKKIKKSLAFTNFMAPVPHPELGFGEAKYQIYTTYRVQEPLERIAENRNDNLGGDVARYINQVTVGGVPIKWVPYLEANDTEDPLYGVNWKSFRPFVKKGANMRRNPPKQAPLQHTVRNVFIDNWMNYICYNLRTCWVGSK